MNVQLAAASPPRGFPEEEFAARTHKLQKAMHDVGCDAVVLTTEPNVRYFSGFFTQFWQSPTRPWFLIIPLDGKPIAVIPEIGSAGMMDTWLDDVRTWPSPRPQDDGVSLLLDCINGLPKRFGKIGMTLGAETMLRMPQRNFSEFAARLDGAEVIDVGAMMHQQRMVKSALEIEKTRYICHLASEAFAKVETYARAGMNEREVCKQMQIDLLSSGADTAGYMVAGSGKGGYDSIIMGPTNRVLEAGDILIIDTGSTWDGYFCDFDRNYTVGQPSADVKSGHARLIEATHAGFEAAKPGAVIADLFHAMNDIVNPGRTGSDAGRLGHGLGMQLTEWPSIIPEDVTALVPGMVLTLEPNIVMPNGKMMVHEENIVITDTGADYISAPQDPEIRVIG